MASVEPTFNALPGTSCVETNVDTFGRIISTDTLVGETSDEHIFDGCFDERESPCLPQLFAFGHSFPAEESRDFAYTTSWSTHRPEHQIANPYIGSAVET